MLGMQAQKTAMLSSTAPDTRKGTASAAGAYVSSEGWIWEDTNKTAYRCHRSNPGKVALL